MSGVEPFREEIEAAAPWWARWATEEFTLGTHYFLTKWGAERYYWRRFIQIGGRRSSSWGILEPIRLRKKL